MTTVNFQVLKSDFRQTRVVETDEASSAADGELLLTVDRFALTANNITYALYGDILGYWQFYPIGDEWGVIPCWGFATVTDSGCPDVSVGERLFGYWPMANRARLTPKAIEPGVVIEGAESRQPLNPFYNRYTRLGVAPAITPEDEGWQSIFRPLGITGFMLEDYVQDSDAWGARRVILASASSKTALATAHFMKSRGACRVVGLTSESNRKFTGSFAVYDEILAYDSIETLDGADSVYIDMAGNLSVTRRVHEHLGAALKHSILVGGTHWESTGQDNQLPGPEPEFYFVPDYIVRRMGDWGEAGLTRRFDAAWQGLLPVMESGISLEMHSGQNALLSCYKAMLDGQSSPEKGLIFEL